MVRVRLITNREDAGTPEQVAIYDKVTESRGTMVRPFEVLAHVPALAGPLSDVGAEIRFHGRMSDHDRELVILTCATLHNCEIEWRSHEAIALASGVRQEALDALLAGNHESLNVDEAALVDYVNALVADSAVPAVIYDAIASRFDESTMVELATTVGYYTLLAYVMNSVEAC